MVKNVCHTTGFSAQEQSGKQHCKCYKHCIEHIRKRNGAQPACPHVYDHYDIKNQYRHTPWDRTICCCIQKVCTTKHLYLDIRHREKKTYTRNQYSQLWGTIYIIKEVRWRYVPILFTVVPYPTTNQKNTDSKENVPCKSSHIHWAINIERSRRSQNRESRKPCCANSTKSVKRRHFSTVHEKILNCRPCIFSCNFCKDQRDKCKRKNNDNCNRG